jgi:hypothetical protein
MSDSQRPRRDPGTPTFEVPDLELEPAPRSFRQPAKPLVATSQRAAEGANQGAPNLFDDDSFQTGSLSLDLEPVHGSREAVLGSLLSFEDPASIELGLAAPNSALRVQANDPPHPTERIEHRGGHTAWPTGRALDGTQLELDPVEIAILADYGDAPQAVQLAPAYAYRVFARQRELKRQLTSIAAECERAQAERETTLAELARATRPSAEKVAQFQRLLAPLIELEAVATQRGQALDSINQQLGAHSGQFDAELARIADQLATQQQLEQAISRTYEAREADAKRAEAKLKRLHIEIRALTRVAETKLGPAGGEIPEPEASSLSALQARVEQITPEVAHAQAELARAKAELDRVHLEIGGLRQSERSITRKKHALREQYRNELQLRGQGLTESESQQRAALADLGRAVLAAAGSVDVTSAWLERVRSVSERADKLLVRREMQVRAIDSFDSTRVRQGVQLAVTALSLFGLLILFKLIF